MVGQAGQLGDKTEFFHLLVWGKGVEKILIRSRERVFYKGSYRVRNDSLGGRFQMWGQAGVGLQSVPRELQAVKMMAFILKEHGPGFGFKVLCMAAGPSLRLTAFQSGHSPSSACSM